MQQEIRSELICEVSYLQIENPACITDFRPAVQRIEIFVLYQFRDIHHLSFGVEYNRQLSQQSCFRSQSVPLPPIPFDLICALARFNL